MRAVCCEARPPLTRNIALLTVTALLCVVGLWVSTAGAATWVVHPDGSGDAPTMQAAVDSAAVGDTVLVSPGIYTDLHEDTAGEYAAVVMKSGIVLRSAEGAAKTVIDVKSASAARGIACRGCDSSTVVEGFTIQGGDTFTGAGLMVEGGAPVIRSNNILGAYGGFGAGMMVTGGAAPDVIGNIFDLNEACCGPGGAIMVEQGSAPTISGNVFTRNTSFSGGAVALQHSGGVIEDNEFALNLATEGGALSVWSSDPVIRRNSFSGNHSSTGGGAVVFAFGGEAQFLDNVVFGNSADGNGGGIRIEGAAPTITSTTIVDNVAGQGGGVFITSGAAPQFSRVIVASNRGSGGVYCEDMLSMPTFGCTNVFGNEGEQYGGHCADPTGDGGNVSVDPRFCAPDAADYTLCADSPCAPGNHPDEWDCGLIGALGATCGSDCLTAVEAASWGAIKALFR